MAMAMNLHIIAILLSEIKTLAKITHIEISILQNKCLLFTHGKSVELLFKILHIVPYGIQLINIIINLIIIIIIIIIIMNARGERWW